MCAQNLVHMNHSNHNRISKGISQILMLKSTKDIYSLKTSINGNIHVSLSSHPKYNYTLSLVHYLHKNMMNHIVFAA